MILRSKTRKLGVVKPVANTLGMTKNCFSKINVLRILIRETFIKGAPFGQAIFSEVQG